MRALTVAPGKGHSARVEDVPEPTVPILVHDLARRSETSARQPDVKVVIDFTLAA